MRVAKDLGMDLKEANVGVGRDGNFTANLGADIRWSGRFR